VKYRKRSKKNPTRDLDIEKSVEIWNLYPPGSSFEEVASGFGKYVAQQHTALGDVSDDSIVRQLSNWAQLIWSWCWAEDGFLTLTSSEKYAAALMLTDYPQSSVELITPPARAFRVRVPNNLLFVEGGNQDGSDFSLNWVYVTPVAEFLPDGTTKISGYSAFHASQPLWDENHSPAFRGGSGLSFCELFATGAGELTKQFGVTAGSPKGKRFPAINLSIKYVVGLLMQLQFSPHKQETKKPYHGTNFDGSAPVHRKIVIGAPITVDTRAAVRVYLDTEKRPTKNIPLAYQYCVRGHPRNQAFGPGHSLRKLIWIEPFWKGPKDAPILVRPHHVEGEDA